MGNTEKTVHGDYIGESRPVQHNGTPREKYIEADFVAYVEKSWGGKALPLTGPGLEGMPECLVILPGGKIGFVAIGKDNLESAPLEKKTRKLLRRWGFPTFVIDGRHQRAGIVFDIDHRLTRLPSGSRP